MSHWMKVEFTTPNKPELMAAARMCNISQAEAFLAFFRLWTYFDEHTDTGFVKGFTTTDLDEMAGIEGFGKAMVKVGWIEEDTRGVSVINWDKHNSNSAKKRALIQRRVQKCRAAKRWGNNV